jgi:hypothetical protein
MSEDNVTLGTRWEQLVEALRYKREERGFDSSWYNCNFIDVNLPTSLWPWGRLSFLRVRAVGAYG